MSTALRLYLVTAGAGAVVMALEIYAGRMLAPIFGNSVYVWGSAISVFLAALAVGYVLGGRLADRTPRLDRLGRLLLLASVCLLLLVLFSKPTLDSLGRSLSGSRFSPLLAATLLFGPPTVLLATVSPFAIRLAARDLAGLGNVAGRLFALSTGGSLAGALGCTFVLIPWLDREGILELLLLVTLALTMLAASDRASENRWVLATALLLALVPWVRMAAESSEEPLALRVTPYQTIEVRERDGRRTLVSDGVPHSALELGTGEPALSYPRYAIAPLLFGRPDSALILGLGGGTTGRYLQRGLPELELDFVEIDRAMAELARDYMGFEQSGRVRLHLGDARRFLADSERRWDLVFCDTYLGLSVPFHLTTVEFFRLVRSRLDEGGVVAVNVAAPIDQPFTAALVATLRRVFPQLYAFDVPGVGNVVLVATLEEERLSEAELLERAKRLGAELPFDPTLEEVARRRVETEDLDARDLVLRDDHAPVDRLLHLGRRPR